MAYKYQFGAAILSGALDQEGTVVIKDDAGAVKVALENDGDVSGSGNFQMGGTVKLDGTAVAVATATDGLFFKDSDGLMKVDSVGDIRDLGFAVVSADATIAAGGALTIANNAINNAKMADDSVGAAELIDDSVGAAAMADNAVATAVIVDDAVTSAKIATGAVVADGIAAGAVLTAGLGDNQVTLAKMAGLTRGSIILGDASGDPSALAKGNASTFLQSDGTDLAYVAMSGDATLNAGALTIADNAVTLAKMAGLTRGSIILGDASGDPSALAKGAASTFLQSDGTDLAYVAMSGDATLSAGAITIANDAITSAKIATGAVIADGIAAGAVESGALNDNVISGQTDIGADLATTDEFLVSDNGVKKRSDLSRLAKMLAGAGMGFLNGQLTVQGNQVALRANSETLTEGYNYFADIGSGGASATVTLPASPSVGDVVTVKAGDLDLGTGKKITINRGDGAHSIDGASALILESPFASVTLFYAVANKWRIV